MLILIMSIRLCAGFIDHIAIESTSSAIGGDVDVDVDDVAAYLCSDDDHDDVHSHQRLC